MSIFNLLPRVSDSVQHGRGPHDLLSPLVSRDGFKPTLPSWYTVEPVLLRLLVKPARAALHGQAVNVVSKIFPFRHLHRSIHLT